MAIVTLDILAHADFSGRLRKSKKAPGVGVFSAAVNALRSKNPQGTLLLDAGDEFSTTFWPGLPMVKSVSLLKTDAMTLGNHEFDRGEDFLNSCIAHSDFPILCANIVRKEDSCLIPGTRPWIMLERKGVKIAVLGITTEYTPFMVTASSFLPYKALSCVEAVKKYLPQMQQAGAQITVLLAHIPFYVEDDGSISGELADVLKKIPPVDVCIGGHIPGDYAGMYGDTIVLKGGFSGKSLCHASLSFDAEANIICDKKCEVLLTDWSAKPEETCQSHADFITDPFKDFFEKPLTTTNETWEVHLSSETKLGNFLAQSVQEAAGTQIAYINATSSGGFIQPGTVTAEDITEVMGFNDPIFRAEITGAQIWELFELVYVPERYGNNAGLMHSGLIVSIDHTKPAFHKVQSICLRDGTPVNMNGIYTVATSEYMSSGGNDTGLVANKLTWIPTGVRMYDALFASIERHHCLFVTPEQRMIEIGRPENDNAPF